MSAVFRSVSISLFVAVVAVFLMLPNISEARTVVRSSDTVSIGQDQLIEGDLYTAAEIINISGRIEEDLLAAGGEVTVNGEVGADVLILGGNVDVHGVIGDDLRVIGGNVTIAEPVLGDVFIVGGTVRVLDTASIAGDLTVVGSSVEVSGVVEGRVLGWIETLRIDSNVLGDVEVTTNSLTLGDKAVIGGNVQYVSQEQLVRSQSATVSGEIVRNDPVVSESSTSSPTSVILPLLVLLFSVALWYLVSRRMLQRVTNRALLPGIRPILIGGLTLLLAPFAISILLVSMLGFLAGFALLATYMLFLVLAITALPAVLGQFAMLMVQKNPTPLSLLTLLIGTLVVAALVFIPIIGPIVLTGFLILTFGALVDLLIRSNR
jgi:cytoskeletal protein CcmA (bactofilin family)